MPSKATLKDGTVVDFYASEIFVTKNKEAIQLISDKPITREDVEAREDFDHWY